MEIGGGENGEVGGVEARSDTYRECQKNHAAAKGGHVVDGCGEFMPSGEEGTPESLKCAACECHRNFHRKESDRRNYNYSYTPAARTPVMMAFGGAAESSSEGLQRRRQQQQQASGSRKRFRTKFTQEQKEKMMGFAQNLGWKIQKQHENQVHQFCQDLGFNRQVLKVWMHNNKPNTNKKP